MDARSKLDSGSETQVSARWKEEVVACLGSVRARTLALVGSLDEEALRRQVRDYVSPLIWDLGHLADFERLWLIDALEGRSEGSLSRRFDALETPRPRRGELPLPGREEVLRHLETVRARVLEPLRQVDSGSADRPGQTESRAALLRDGFAYRMVAQHEAQHQETMLQALDLPDEDWGAGGAAATRRGVSEEEVDLFAGDDEERRRVAEGPFALGTDDRRLAYDNERRRHRVELPAFDIERYPVTNRRWLAFIEDAGYRRPELWSEAGDLWRHDSGVDAPQGWSLSEGGVRLFRFGAPTALRVDEPVLHVSFWEAEAFATWSGGRLPSEQEWEKAAAWGTAATEARRYPWGEREPEAVGFTWSDPTSTAFGPGPGGLWGPQPIGRRPELASEYGVEDLIGSAYAWTSSPLRGYPGFEPFPYPEYSEVFFGDDYRVLRGPSWAAHPVLWRNTYRNWDLPERRQIFAGVRVVYDV